MQNRSNFFRYLIVGILLSYILFWLPLPYVVLQPGTAENIGPMVESTHANVESGDFYLTTISMSYPQANVAGVVKAIFQKYASIIPKAEIYHGEPEQEFTRRQEYIMLSSQGNALQAAYQQALVPYSIKINGVIVMSTLESMPAANVLQSGDRITKLNNQKVDHRDGLIETISNMAVGDPIKVTYEREQGVSHTVELVLADLTAASDVNEQVNEKGPRPGLGITLVDLQTIEADDPQNQVEVAAGEIGGPSAGLMFALEIYDRLVEQDITKGYKIAGTGTITPDGEVGVIGGIDFKVVAADRMGADIFFAPNDLYLEEYDPILNATLAQEQAEALNTKMRVVPVETLQEALEVLEALPMKQD